VPPPQLTAGSATDGEINASAAVSLPSSGIHSLGQPGGGPGWEIPGGSSAERASNIPFSPSQDSTPNDAAMIAAAHLAATSPATDTVASVPTATSAFSPASASAAIGPGPDTPRGVYAIAASPAKDTVDSVPRETSAFGPVSASSAVDPGPGAPRRVSAMAATTGTDPVDAALMRTSAFAPASRSSGSGAASDTPGQIPAIGASPEVIIAGPDRSAGHAREDTGSISSVSLTAAAPNPVTANTGLAGSPVQGSAFLSPSDSQLVGLAEQLTHHVMTSIDNGGREVVLQLHPPELGELTVRILVSGRDVSAWFGSPQIPVQQALNQTIGRLQADLGSAGYNLDSAWVGADASGSGGWDARSLVPARGAAARSSSDGSPAPLTPSAASGVSIYV
jgi:flagellar hook-length control protein FliK